MNLSLKERVQEDMKAALRAHEAEKLSTIRMLLAAIKQREVDERISLDDTQVLGIVEKLVKQRRDAIEQFRQGGRDDLVAKESQEIVYLNAYLPQPLTAEAVTAMIRETLEQLGAKQPGDMGKVMAALKPKLAGRADMKQVSEQVKQTLAG